MLWESLREVCKVQISTKFQCCVGHGLRILYIPREEEKCCRVKEGEGDGKDEGGWGEGGVVRTRYQRQLSEEDGNKEEGEVG